MVEGQEVLKSAESTIGRTAPVASRDGQPHCAEMAAMTAEQRKLKLWLQNTSDVIHRCELKRQRNTRFAIQAKGPDGKWTRKPLAYRESNNVHLLITRPPEICVNLVFKHIHAASSYTICRQFVPFIYCPL